MGLFERADIRVLSEKLLGLAAGREARRQLTDRDREFLANKLVQT